MDLLAQAQAGFQGIDAAAAAKALALKNLQKWLTDAEFAPYRPQLEWLIGQQQWAGLLDRFYQILPFGTGGRRGAVGIGPNRMNLWTLGASVQGHCEYLKEKFPGHAQLSVALAYDVRQFEDKRKNYNPALPNPVLHLSSKGLAQHAAGIYAANGIQPIILPSGSPRYLATPELSFIIRLLKAHGGLNISASHNPPDDNGGKFYDERGGQPVPPDDQIMADLVEQVTVIKTLPFEEAVRAGKVRLLDEAPHMAYIELCRKQALLPPPRFDEIQVVFTPLHGVGGMTARETLEQQGFRVAPVAEQSNPDSQFTNVTQSPNPEVPASMDKAEKLAQSLPADIVLSTDPDADRIGCMVPAGAPSAPWRYITGNEIAVLLTHYKLRTLKEQGRLPSSPIVVKTDVTTSLVTRVAQHFGAQVVDNLLVGFKYIAEVLWQLEQNGSYEDVRGRPEDYVIGVEESHGVLVTPHIRDKDAAGAALLLAELALDRKRAGQAVSDYLDDIYREFGYCRNELANLAFSGIEGKEQMARMLDGLRSKPLTEIGGLKVTAFEDLRDENGRCGPLKGATDAASRNVLVFRLGEHGRITLRPSGTEPKAKAYVEVCSPPRKDLAAAVAAMQQLAKKLSDDFLEKALGIVGLKPPGTSR
ncbi:MAG: phospho-sugar mutase [Planctomycetia bacterium]|nr:phospho-sugar mutase [Planctomycetia bacterium]